jgi:hypothetical protein
LPIDNVKGSRRSTLGYHQRSQKILNVFRC